MVWIRSEIVQEELQRICGILAGGLDENGAGKCAGKQPTERPAVVPGGV